MRISDWSSDVCSSDLGVAGLRSEAATIAATVALLVSVSGVIATMIPYAAEIYPVQLRGTGSGVIAASSKFGGILGAAFGVAGLFEHFELSALLIDRKSTRLNSRH